MPAFRSLPRSGGAGDDELAYVIHIDERTPRTTFRQGTACHALSHRRPTREDQWWKSHRCSSRLVLHGEDDQVVDPATTAPRSAELVVNGMLKTYPGYPHGMPTTHADVINPDLLAFIRS
ncbi:alpha/beta fold hydrolase [Kribbella sp. CA-245084]|uniref:alpha/beta fold hydrolase n=1 Tax=Kribbella sp. CA-245084 TaxID=3239940 RepID=UPI003D8D0917